MENKDLELNCSKATRYRIETERIIREEMPKREGYLDGDGEFFYFDSIENAKKAVVGFHRFLVYEQHEERWAAATGQGAVVRFYRLRNLTVIEKNLIEIFDNKIFANKKDALNYLMNTPYMKAEGFDNEKYYTIRKEKLIVIINEVVTELNIYNASNDYGYEKVYFLENN